MFVKIPGFDHYLLDTDKWLVYSLFSGKYLSHKNKSGYICMSLSDLNGNQFYFLLHRLIYKLFVNDIPEGYDVHHIDGNKTNNCPTNLCAVPKSEHVSKHRKGKAISNEQKIKISKSLSGRPHTFTVTEEVREKMREHNWSKNPNISSEVKLKISQAHKGKPSYKHRKPIVQYTLEGVPVKEYEMISDAVKEGFIFSSITRCCQGTLKTHGGFKWRYKLDNDR